MHSRLLLFLHELQCLQASLVAQPGKLLSACNEGDLGSIPASGRCPGEGNGNLLQYSWAFLVAQLVKNCLQCRRPGFDSWVGKICWRRDRLPTLVFLGFPDGSAGKESTCNVGDLGSLPGLGRSPEEGNGYPLQYSGLENSMDCIVHRVAESHTTK